MGGGSSQDTKNSTNQTGNTTSLLDTNSNTNNNSAVNSNSSSNLNTGSASNQFQNSAVNPWAAAQPALGGILTQLNGNLGNTGVTGAESGALNTLQGNANNYSNMFGPQVTNYANTLLGGGGANNQAGNVQSGYNNYFNQTNPLASNTNYNPYDTPGFKDAINTATSDITNNVNGSFAGAGRDFSGANSMALGRGLTQGLAPTIAAQYNANVNNQQGAAGNLYNAGNTNAGILSGLQQQYLSNQGQGVTAAGQSNDINNAGASATMAAEAQRRNIPVQALGLLSNIGIPIAGLGQTTSGATSGVNTGTQTGNNTGSQYGTENGTQSGTQSGSGTSNMTGNSTGQTNNQMSGADQFMRIMQGIGSLGNLWPKSGGGSGGSGG